MLPLFHHPIDFFMAASWSLLYLTTTSRCSGARPRWLSIFCPLLSAFNTKVYSKLGPKIFPVKKKRKITSARFHIATFFPSFFILFSLTMRAEKKSLLQNSLLLCRRCHCGKVYFSTQNILLLLTLTLQVSQQNFVSRQFKVDVADLPDDSPVEKTF